MWTVGLLGLTGMIGLLVNLYTPRRWLRNLAIITAIAACTLAPTVYTLATVNVAHTGSIPTAGPNSTAMRGSNNESSQANSQLVQYLLDHQHGATWLVAVASANESAAIQLTSSQPVMAVGGFNGSDTPLTPEQFKQLVKAGKVKYYAISSHSRGGGGPGGPGGQAGGAPGANQNQTGQNSQTPSTQNNNSATQNNQADLPSQTGSAQPPTTSTAPQTD